MPKPTIQAIECLECGEQCRSYPKYNGCAGCRVSVSEYNKRLRTIRGETEKKKKSANIRISERKKNNLCVTCGLSEPDSGGRRCSACCDRLRLWKQRRTEKGHCLTCGVVGIVTGKKYCQSCIDAQALKIREWGKQLKAAAFAMVGGDSGIACKCCGITDINFLTIDHINGDGAEHRKTTGYGSNFYRWLLDTKATEGLQLLCYNCNCAKSNGDTCPHNRATVDDGYAVHLIHF